jgi:hypothetical protein
MLRTTRILKFPNQLALVALALCGTAVLGKSQTYRGTFTLPFEAHWAGATLPAGDYTISMPEAVQPFLVYIRGERTSAIVFAQLFDTREASNDSSLTMTKIRGNEAITELRAGQLGMTFGYAVSKTKAKAEIEMTSMARVNVPVREINDPVAAR